MQVAPQQDTPKLASVVRARATRELCDDLKRAAEREQIPISEFVRRAVLDRCSDHQPTGEPSHGR